MTALTPMAGGRPTAHPEPVPGAGTPVPGSLDPWSVLSVRAGDLPGVPLLFATLGARIYVIPSTPDARWAAVALREGWCRVRLGPGGARTAGVELVVDPVETRQAQVAIREKYGESTWREHFAGSHRVLRIDPAGPARPAGELERVRNEFDAAAARYAATVDEQPVGRYLKRRSEGLLLAALVRSDPLLEIGPGSGIETLPLLAAGHSIVAVDISPRMLRELSARAAASGLAAQLETVEGDLCRLGRAMADRPDGAFAGAYSTFGALNLASDVSALGGALGRLVRPGGRLIFTSLNRPGLAPMLWEAISGDRRGLRMRSARRIPAGEYRFALDVHPRNPSFWDTTLAPWFVRCGTRAVSVLSPPFDSRRLVEVLGPTGGRRATRVDAAVSKIGALAPLGEWSMLEYRRVGPVGWD
jgi:SAM-dependent methyltransferase